MTADDTTEPLHVQALRRFANGRPMTDREQDIFNAGWQARGGQRDEELLQKARRLAAGFACAPGEVPLATVLYLSERPMTEQDIARGRELADRIEREAGR